MARFLDQLDRLWHHKPRWRTPLNASAIAGGWLISDFIGWNRWPPDHFFWSVVVGILGVSVVADWWSLRPDSWRA